MKNFIISAFIVTFLTTTALYLSKVLLNNSCFSYTSQFVLGFVQIAIMSVSVKYFFDSTLKILVATSVALTAYTFSFSFVYLNTLWLTVALLPAIISLFLLADIRDSLEVEEKEKMKYVKQAVTLMLTEFIILSVAIIHLAK
ncbi:MAG: hypothetical protein UT05_C0003G0060 [Parcubacteria group bacterium GW2011_GWF2_38_76]|nr:MAG: hypothetical protein UT05_C0003G0060 [Parcubacteria group bacterium GW2011_GWF2_38_76]HBM46168.1 hypothetical protein [Patescibacteria group bacterium]